MAPSPRGADKVRDVEDFEFESHPSKSVVCFRKASRGTGISSTLSFLHEKEEFPVDRFCPDLSDVPRDAGLKFVKNSLNDD